MFVFLLAALAIGGTLVATPGGRRTIRRIRARGLVFPSVVGLVGLLMIAKGELLVGAGVAITALIWAGQKGKAQRADRAEGQASLHLREARALLGLTEGADREAIVAAHRRLIALHHPDVGGQGHLAGRINAARDLLLDHLLP